MRSGSSGSSDALSRRALFAGAAGATLPFATPIGARGPRRDHPVLVGSANALAGMQAHYADLAGGAGIAEGIGILGHILGSKDSSRNVAARAAGQTGVSADLIKKMLPMIATLVMGALSRQAGQQGMAGAGAGSGGGQSGDTLGMLNSFLDADRDGSAIDDVINLAKKFF